jgi:hypothetical protein
MLFIAKDGLPDALINRLVRLAAFQNPEFYEAQSLRLSTFGKPRIIGCAEDFPNHRALPRGCAGELHALLKDCGVKLEIEDKRNPGIPIDASFQGALRDEQAQAVDAVLRTCGLTAGPGRTELQPQRNAHARWRGRGPISDEVEVGRIGALRGGRSKRSA